MGFYRKSFYKARAGFGYGNASPPGAMALGGKREKAFLEWE
jgi:hypothetical protein